jgi:hypothetical protein
MAIDVGSGQDTHGVQAAVISGGGSGPSRQARAASRQRRKVILGIGLAALARFVGSRRFLSYVISGALGLAALASLSRDNQTRTVARMAAWDKQRSLRDKRAVEARLRKGEARLRRNR